MIVRAAHGARSLADRRFADAQHDDERVELVQRAIDLDERADAQRPGANEVRGVQRVDEDQPLRGQLAADLADDVAQDLAIGRVVQRAVVFARSDPCVGHALRKHTRLGEDGRS